MTTHDASPRRESRTVLENEQHEAAAFDRLATHQPKALLRTSDSTFLRYRAALLGRPRFRMYPDLVFTHIGRHFNRLHPDPKPLTGLRILDLGAGDGVWSVILAEQGADVTSIEIAPKQVELARERMHIHSLAWAAHVGSAYRLKDRFPPRSFDCVFGQAILHHLTADLETVYDGIAHLLRTGGLAVSSEPYCASRRLRRIREHLEWMVPVERESEHERPLSDADLAGLPKFFSQVEVERFDVFSKLARRLIRSRALETLLFRLDRVVLRTNVSGYFASGVFIAVRK